ncbi:hypothetical protein JCM33374_g6066 [Metschnikowia sp. JCM 33374]|nr:hypothetical protein JCM33374_g6066 [Metschnikowia sp. JCM 33374]
MVVTFLEEGPDSAAFHGFLDKKDDVVFHGPQGLTVMGTNGVQVWDVAFMCQYLIMAGLSRHSQYHEMILKGYWFLRRSQFTEECVDGSYRDKRKGAWPFSTKTQGYTVSDCTVEKKAIIMAEKMMNTSGPQIVDKIEENLEDAVDRILFIQKHRSFEYGSFLCIMRKSELLQ